MWRKGLTRRRDHAQDGEPINKCYKLNTLSKQNNARSVRPIHFQLLEVDLQMAGWSKFSDCPGLYEMHWHTLTSSLVIVRGQLEWLQTHLWVSHRKVMTHSNAVSGDLSSLGFSLLNLCVGKTYCTKESYRYGAPPVFRAKTNKHKGVYILCAYVYIYIYIHTLSLSIYLYLRHPQDQNILKPSWPSSIFPITKVATTPSTFFYQLRRRMCRCEDLPTHEMPASLRSLQMKIPLQAETDTGRRHC